MILNYIEKCWEHIEYQLRHGSQLGRGLSV